MNLGLFNKRYLAAGQYTIADMICYPWASSWSTRKIDIDEFPNVKSWLEEIAERPAVKKAMAMGPEFREDPSQISPEEQARRRKLVGRPAGPADPRGVAAGGGRLIADCPSPSPPQGVRGRAAKSANALGSAGRRSSSSRP